AAQVVRAARGERGGGGSARREVRRSAGGAARGGGEHGGSRAGRGRRVLEPAVGSALHVRGAGEPRGGGAWCSVGRGAEIGERATRLRQARSGSRPEGRALRRACGGRGASAT